jgi:hypothetical protein
MFCDVWGKFSPRRRAWGRHMFTTWQREYAKHGVSTFPVTITADGKKPCVRNYLTMGLRASSQLALKWPDAQSFGFSCGRQNRLTIIDMDDTDPKIIAEGERLFGTSPLLWRTGSGKFAMAFRHNGEGRHIRPMSSVPIDLLGGGFCVAPPSAGATRPYEIIRGSLEDLDNLPFARIPNEIAALPRPSRVPIGQRNESLLRHCR